jgi:hypothetical protein
MQSVASAAVPFISGGYVGEDKTAIEHDSTCMGTLIYRYTIEKSLWDRKLSLKI